MRMSSPPDSKISTNPTTFEFSGTKLLPEIPSNKPKRYPHLHLLLHRQIDTSAPEEEKDNNENFNPRRKQNLPAYLLPNIIPSGKKIHYYLANSFRGSQLAILHLRIAIHSQVVARRPTKKKKRSVAFSLRCTKCAFGSSRFSHIHCPCALTSEAINSETLG